MYSEFQMKLLRLQYLIVIYWILWPWDFFFSSGSRLLSVLENTAQYFTSRLTSFFLKHKPKMLSQGLLNNNDRKPVVRQVIFCLRQCKPLSVKCSKGTFSQPDSTGSQALAGTRPTVRYLIMSAHCMWLGEKFKEVFQWALGLELLLFK